MPSTSSSALLEDLSQDSWLVSDRDRDETIGGIIALDPHDDWDAQLQSMTVASTGTGNSSTGVAAAAATALSPVPARYLLQGLPIHICKS
jgi:hypothetical protein